MKVKRGKIIEGHSVTLYLGSIMFKVVKCPPEYIEIRKRLRAQETALDNIQTPSIQDRTINDHLSMFVEVKNGKKNNDNHSDLSLIHHCESYRWN